MLSIMIIPFILAMFMSINMGASGTAPSFSAAYGANLIRKDLIPGLFGIFVFFGAILSGKAVSKTIGHDIIPMTGFTLSITIIVLLAISLTLLFANLLGVPQSTSQATVTALIGVGLYLNNLLVDKLFTQIIPTWFILPVFAFIITFVLGKLFYFLKLNTFESFNFDSRDNKIRIPVILIGCYAAFSIGSNNVANATGIISAMMLNELNMSIAGNGHYIILLLSTLICAPLFGIGSSILGVKNLETTGKKIVQLGPLGALVIAGSTATLLLIASLFGIPASEVQLSVGAIIGLSISKQGFKETFRKRAIKKVMIVWLIAPLIAFVLAYTLTAIFDVAGLLTKA